MSGSSFDSNKSSGSSLSSISLSGSIEPIGNSGEANKDNSGESDQPDQNPKTEADLDDKKAEDSIEDKKEGDINKEEPIEAAPEITIVQPDLAKKSSSKENLAKSSNINIENTSDDHNKESLNNSKDSQQPTNGSLKTSENIPANLSPQKPEELTPKKT